MWPRPKLVSIPTVAQEQGDLSFCDCESLLPFSVERVYWVRSIPSWARRGGHAHRVQSEFFVVVAGACTLRLLAPDREEVIFRVEAGGDGVFLPPGWWREIDDYLEGTCCVVLASGAYDENDYIRESSAFFNSLASSHDSVS